MKICIILFSSLLGLIVESPFVETLVLSSYISSLFLPHNLRPLHNFILSSKVLFSLLGLLCCFYTILTKIISCQSLFLFPFLLLNKVILLVLLHSHSTVSLRVPQYYISPNLFFTYCLLDSRQRAYLTHVREQTLFVYQ